MNARLVDEIGDLTSLAPAWDELACASALPYCAPGWMLSWWKHKAPPGGELRVIVVEDGARLAGIFPFYSTSPGSFLREWRLLSAGVCTRIGPLASPGDEVRVASAAAQCLAGIALPDLIAFEGLPAGVAWPALLRANWPSGRRPALRRELTMVTPIAAVGDGYDPWLARRGKTVKRALAKRRDAERQGFRVRLSQAAERERDVAELLRLYRARRAKDGISERISAGVEEMLVDIGQELGDRFQLWLLDRDDTTYAAYLMLAAGAETAAWGGGFDAEVARLSPLHLLRVAGVEHAAATGAERVEFGEGTGVHKTSFADSTVGVVWETLLLRGRRYPLVRARLLPKHSRLAVRKLARRLPVGAQERLRSVKRRWGRRHTQSRA
jgi:CelD/BcsL family acetyltransferase involved in cellulose biosynthesis